LNGIILHTPYYDNARFTSMCMEAMEDAWGLKVDIIEACNRIKKKAPAKHQSLRSVDPCPINRSLVSYRVQSGGKLESSNRCLRSSYQAWSLRPCPMIRLQRIHNFWCSMLVFTPFA
jgi:hypothetical protein